jgi:hypothetical protein
MCNYNFNLPIDPAALFATAQSAIVARGGNATQKGSKVLFSIPTPLGQIDGICTLVEQATLNITVTKKPDIVPCALIREKLVSYLTQAVKMQAKSPQPQRSPS